MGSSGGGVPSLGGGFFPPGPQFNPGGLPIMDLMGWANSGGTQAQPLDQTRLGSIFGAPQQGVGPPPVVPRAAGRSPYATTGPNAGNIGNASFGTFGDLAYFLNNPGKYRGNPNKTSR
jgi:hypothetical protein